MQTQPKVVELVLNDGLVAHTFIPDEFLESRGDGEFNLPEVLKGFHVRLRWQAYRDLSQRGWDVSAAASLKIGDSTEQEVDGISFRLK